MSKWDDTQNRPPEIDARLAQLEETARDLAAAQRDLRQQMHSLVHAVEASRPAQATAPGGSSDPGEPPSAGASGAAESAARRFVKRGARFVLRKTLGVARQVWRAADPAPPWADAVRITALAAPPAVPWLAVAAAEERRVEIGAMLAKQTDPDVQLDPMAAEWVWLASGEIQDLPATFVETVKLVLAAERPICLWIDPDDGRSPGQWIVERRLWPKDAGIGLDLAGFDLEKLEHHTRRYPDAVLGKLVAPAGGELAALPAPFGPRLRRAAHQSGPYLVPRTKRPRIVEHRVRRPASESPRVDEDGGLLVVLDSSLGGGLEGLVVELLRTAGERVVVVAASPQMSLHERRRLRSLELLTSHVYALGEALPMEAIPAGLATLAERWGLGAVLHVGDGDGSHNLAELKRRRPGLRHVELVLPAPAPASFRVSEHASPHRYVAASAAVARRLEEAGVGAEEIARLPLVSARSAVDPPSSGASGQRSGESLRVVMAGDLVAPRRPEDFVALAYALREDPRFVFELAGDGPVAATVADLARYLAPPRLTVTSPAPAVEEVVATADLVVTMAEQEPFPEALTAGLALGRPVVGAAVDDLPEVLADGACGRLVARAGDVEAFAVALREVAEELADPERHQALAAEARRRAAALSPSTERLVVLREALGLPEPSRDSA